MNRIVLLTAAVIVMLANAASAGEKYALLVGVTEYEHPKFKTLKYAENDVAELSKVLTTGGFKITQLSEGAKDDKLKPKRANIVRELDAILAKCTKRDMILVAFSGHGMQPAGSKENFFCPSDARAHDLKTLIGMAELYEKLDQSTAETKLVVIDACRDDPVAGKGITKVPLPPEGIAVLLSCSPGEQAYESNERKHGIFFYWLLDGLRGKARNDENNITFGQLAEYVQRKVARNVPNMVGEGAKQSPNLVANISGESPLLVKVDKLPALTDDAKEPIAGDATSKNIPPSDSGNSGVKNPPAAADNGKPTGRRLLGNWGAMNETVHFNADGTVILSIAPLYLKGVFTCENGVLDINFPDINWDVRIALEFADVQKTRLNCTVVSANIPNFKIGHQFGWQRVNQAPPQAPPTRQELVATWVHQQLGTTYTMNADHTFVVRFNGQQMTGRYRYGGNVLVVAYDGTNEMSIGIMTWTDMQKNAIRSTIVWTNVQGGNPPGTSSDFTRMR